MSITRRSLSLMLLGAGGALLAGPAVTRILAQDQTPNRREFTIVAKDRQRRQRTHGGDVFRVECKEDEKATFAINDNKNGSYTVVYRLSPAASGPISLRISSVRSIHNGSSCIFTGW